MQTSVITSKGQVTIPKKVRDALRLKRGVRVRFEIEEDGTAHLIPEAESVLTLFGVFRPTVRGVTVEEMNETIAQAAAERES
jgi:antitoxin PrlF